jgi:HK97 family phage prohead protease
VYNLEVDIDHTYVGKGIIYHNSDVTVGRVLPRWTNPKTGEIVTSHVDDTGWYIVAEVRDDVEIADKVWEEVERGNIRSFSIAGSSKDKQEGYKDGKFMTEITKLDIYEITLCEEPVNPMSKFDFFYNPNEMIM